MSDEDTDAEGDTTFEEADEVVLDTGVEQEKLNPEVFEVLEEDPEEGEDELLEWETEYGAGYNEFIQELNIIPYPLTLEIIADGLSLLCKTGDGLSHAYVRLDIHDREITDIDMLQSYIHLRYVDISKNMLRDISPLSALTHLLTLKADDNLLASAKLEDMPYLQTATFNNNRIVTTEGIGHPLLEQLSLNNNRIKEIIGLDASKLTRLHTLELRGNKLVTTDGIYLPKLQNLYLAQNMITRIEGMSRLPGLTTIHLRGNQIENPLGFSESQKFLQYINLRENLVPSANEAFKLSVLPLLRALILADNPCAEQDDYRLETLIRIPTLERLDKEEFTEEERAEAEAIAEKRRKEEEDKATLEAQILSEIEITEQAILEAEAEAESYYEDDVSDYGTVLTIQ